MKKAFIIVMLVVLFASCKNSNDTKETSTNKKTLDSLTTQKKNKTEEIKTLNSELDSLRKLSDSLKALSE